MREESIIDIRYDRYELLDEIETFHRRSRFTNFAFDMRSRISTIVSKLAFLQSLFPLKATKQP